MIFVLGLDFATKYWASQAMTVGEHIPVIGQRIGFTLVHNRGAAFDTFEGMHLFLIIASGLLIAAGLFYLGRYHSRHSRWMLVGASLIVSGGLGNFIDRVRLGYVVDMLDIRILPVFNVADMAVVTGCIMLCFYILFLDKGRDSDEDRGSDEDKDSGAGKNSGQRQKQE